MSRETDNIEKLFSSRLTGAEMDVEGDFWESLNEDVVAARGNRRRTLIYRVASCAAAVALLFTTYAAFRMFAPHEEEMKATLSQVDSNAMTPVPFGDFALSSEKPESGEEIQAKSFRGHTADAIAKANDEDDDNDSVYISFSFSITRSTSRDETGQDNRLADNLWRTGLSNSSSSATAARSNSENGEPNKDTKPRVWNSKVKVGSALPDGNAFKAPVSAGVSVERRLAKHLGIEAGLTYTMLHDNNARQHELSIPVKANIYMAESKRADFYATLGGIASKCVASNREADKGVKAAVMAGVGADYKVNDRLALFAETTVSHHFVDKENTMDLRAARPTNLNLSAGLRITY
jgi:hypothetical protein